MIGWRPEPVPALALVDLSAARWPPAWRPGDVDAVMSALDTVHGLDLPDLPSIPAMLTDSWSTVAADPAPFLGLGLVSASWLSSCLPDLLAASDAATIQLSVPVIAAFGGVLLLAEPLTLRLAIASIATLGGVAVVLRSRVSG